MADKLMIVMVNTDPSDPSELGAPFFQATVAAAMEYEVEVVLTGRAGRMTPEGRRFRRQGPVNRGRRAGRGFGGFYR